MSASETMKETAPNRRVLALDLFRPKVGETVIVRGMEGIVAAA